MNLRETVAEAIDDELQEILSTLLRAGPEFVDDAAANIRFVASYAAIAAMREALLSDEVVEAAAKYMYVDGGNQGVWEQERETYQNRYRGRAETTLEVALAAITAPAGGQE